MTDKKVLYSILNQTSENIAIEDESRKISYKELFEYSNLLADGLIKSGVKNGDVVAIFIQNSIEYVISILAVMKSGAIFLPINNDFPKSRISQIIKLANPKVAIKSITDDVDCCEIVFTLNSDFLFFSNQNIKSGDCSNEILELKNSGEDACYIIFTSGSTGEPKGIVGRHKSLSHFIHWEVGEFNINKNDRVSFIANSTFDVSLRDIFAPLLADGTLVIPNKDTKQEPIKFLNWIEDKKITIMHLVPSLFRLLLKELEHIGDAKKIETVREFLLAGEAIYGRDMIRFKHLTKKENGITNLYGPSETTLAKLFNKNAINFDLPNDIVPIGKPINNSAVLILKNNRLCEIGEIGEIYIKTPFISLGYLKNETLTNEVFIQNPLNSEKDTIYKTGDLGSYLEDRTVKFVGRLDRQIKLNGIRVELLEIEKAILENSKISEVLVNAIKHNDEDRVICYYTIKEPIDKKELIEFLKESLPSYMIPSLFIPLEAFPLSLNGKIDKKALPKPNFLFIDESNFKEATNETEKKVLNIWKNIIGVERISIDTTFFEAGGSSLSAIKALSLSFKEFEVNITLGDFFKNATIKELANLISNSQKSKKQEIKILENREFYESTQTQKRFWLLDKIDKNRTIYNITTAFRLNGEIDLTKLEEAFLKLINRHEILRTKFKLIHDEVVQIVETKSDFKLEIAEVENLDIDFLIKEQSIKEFDLSKPTLLRAIIYNKTILIITMHHIIADITSMDIMAKEISAFYNGETLEPLNFQHKDFANSYNKFLSESQKIKDDLSYWLDELKELNEPIKLPTIDNIREKKATFEGKSLDFEIENSSYEKIKEFAKAQNISMFSTLLAMFYAVIRYESNSSDFIIGTPVIGREEFELDNQLGCFINMLPIRFKSTPNMSFETLAYNINQKVLNGIKHQSYPFDKLVDKLDLPRDIDRHPLFDLMIVYNQENRSFLNLNGVEIEPLNIKSTSSKVDFTLAIEDDTKSFKCKIEYKSELFSENIINRIAKHIKNGSIEFFEKSYLSLNEFDLIDDESLNIIDEMNNNVLDYAKDETIADKFEKIVLQNPNKTALIYNDLTLSFSELNQKANNLSRYLKENFEIMPDDKIALMVDRSEDLIVAIFAILKSNGAYLPIDPSYPNERIEYILSDALPKVIISETKYLNKIDNPNIIDIKNFDIKNFDNPKRNITPNSLAYIIYTSGSTGNPKGVMVENRGVINMVNQARAIMPKDTIKLQFASIAFDASAYEILTTLLNGETLAIIDKEKINDQKEFASYINQKQISMMTTSASFLSTLNLDLVPTLKVIGSAGEAISVDVAIKTAKDRDYYNHYGPTETTVWATTHKVNPNRVYKRVPIGKPIINVKVYILNSDLQLVPIGVIGEICIGGDGVARGYLNQETLTSEKFINHPKFGRIYRSGDLGFVNEFGEIEFLGRVDNQVKIRGFRIELGEIETKLTKIVEINQALVLAKDGELIAYYTVKKAISKERVREELQKLLPEFMIPSYLIELEYFPTNVSGKIDKKTLPNPKELTSKEIVLPKNEKEKALLECCLAILKLKEISMKDNYFLIGGDSIKAIQIISLLSKNYSLNLEVKDIFSYPILEELAGCITSEVLSFSQDEINGEIGMLPIEMWFFETFKGDINHFNQSLILEIDNLDVMTFKKSFKELAFKHDNLRARYIKDENGYKKVILSKDELVVDFSLIDFRDLLKDEAIKRVSQISHGLQKFDISNSMLLKCVIFQTKDLYYIFIAAHHLAIDGVSWRIFLDELFKLYLGGEIAPKTTNAKDYAVALRDYANSKECLKTVDFWANEMNKNQNSEVSKITKPISNHKNSPIFSFELSNHETNLLTKSIHESYNTNVDEILIFALIRAFYKLFETKDDLFEMFLTIEKHGRDDLIKNVSLHTTIGWITTFFHKHLSLNLNRDLGYQIKSIKDELRAVPNGGFDFLPLKYLCENEAKNRVDFSKNPIVIFNYLGEFDDSESDFKLSLVDYGKNIDEEAILFYPIEINSYIQNGIFGCTILVSREYVEIFKNLNSIYKEEIINTINHCLGKETNEISVGDIDYDGFNIDELDNLLGNLS